MSDAKHTPTPWGSDKLHTMVISDYGLGTVPIAVFYNDEDLDFAILACNCHDELVTACEATLKHLLMNRPATGGDGVVIGAVRAILAKVKDAP